MAEPVEPAIDGATIDTLLEAVGGDRAFLDDLIDAFQSDAPTQLAALRSAAASGSAPEIVRPAHSLKSSSASLGALTLARLCGELEARARQGDIAGSAGAIDELTRAVDDAVTGLSDIKQRQDPANAA